MLWATGKSGIPPYTAAARRARRFLETTKGQRAMAVAKIYPEPVKAKRAGHHISPTPAPSSNTPPLPF